MISKLQLVINGQKVSIPLELTDEQLHQIYQAIEIEEPLNGWERPDVGEPVFFVNQKNELCSFEVADSNVEEVDALARAVNCYSNEAVARNIMRGDQLLRELRYIAVTTRKNEVDHENGGYSITYNYAKGCLEIGMTGCFSCLGEIVFETEEAARTAMNNYAAELTWYFTERKDRI